MQDLRWKIWYEGGGSFSDEDGSPYDAPARGVMVIAEVEPAVGRQLWAQRDYYWWNPEKGVWFGGDIFGLWDYLTTPGPKKVLFGRSVRNEEYQHCIKLAIADPRLPAKSARHREEIY